MAQRFGGKFSPGGPSGPQKASIRPPKMRGEFRTALLFIPALILPFTSLNEGAQVLGLALLAAAGIAGGAWLTREGLKAEVAFNARKVARRPLLPRKLVGAGLVGIGAGIASFTNSPSLLTSAIYGAIATALHVAAFGLDPLKDKNVEGIDQYQQDRVARVVDHGEKIIASMKAAIARTGDRALIRRVDGFSGTAERMFRTVEEDPRDLTAARKYMGVYLEGARDATVKYADLVERRPDADARANYESLLNDLEENFTARTERLMADDRTDMDIEIKVLRDRLAREGLTGSGD